MQQCGEILVHIVTLAVIVFILSGESTGPLKDAVENDDVTYKEGIKFLEHNKLDADVTTMPSGLQYKIIKTGNGDEHPTRNSVCMVNYTGYLLNGTGTFCLLFSALTFLSFVIVVV